MGFDLDKFLKFAPRQGIFEVTVLLGAKDQIESRLVIARVRAQVAEKRRRALHKACDKRGCTPTQRSLRRCDWTLIVTNAPSAMMRTSAVITVYRVRWQVELLFKLAKSEAALDRTNSDKRERVLCELYAKLIALCWFGRLLSVVDQATEHVISGVRAWRKMRGKVMMWGIKLGTRQGVRYMQELVRYLHRRAKVSKRQKYPSTRQRIEQAGAQREHRRLIDPLGYMQIKVVSKRAEVDDLFEHTVVELSKAA